MKKNRMMRVASALLVAVLLTTCGISGTFAKYVSSATGTDSARVANWVVNLEGETMTNSFTFDLFNTINDTANDNAETDVETDLIAPGTEGSFEINLTTNSEVTSKYSVTYSATLDSVPIKFSLNGQDWVDSISNLNVEGRTLAIGEQTETITVYWMWAFGEDVVDNTHSGKTISVTATITVEQVD